MDIPILFEDDSVLVVNKPPGIVVNNAQSVQSQTIQDWAKVHLAIEDIHHIPLSPDSFYERAGIVHRLDKETSGCLIIAKTPEVFSALQTQFKERVIQKTYIAIAHGTIVPEKGEIRAPVGRLPWNRERFGILPGGKESVTEYAVTATFERRTKGQKEVYSVVTLHPLTGRTHQIRVHLKYINHPIVGDFLYAGRKTSRADRLWAPRVMLHAWKIMFTHPQNNGVVAIEAPIPDDMVSAMRENN